MSSMISCPQFFMYCLPAITVVNNQQTLDKFFFFFHTRIVWIKSKLSALVLFLLTGCHCIQYMLAGGDLFKRKVGVTIIFIWSYFVSKSGCINMDKQFFDHLAVLQRDDQRPLCSCILPSDSKLTNVGSAS